MELLPELLVFLIRYSFVMGRDFRPRRLDGDDMAAMQVDKLICGSAASVAWVRVFLLIFELTFINFD